MFLNFNLYFPTNWVLGQNRKNLIKLSNIHKIFKRAFRINGSILINKTEFCVQIGRPSMILRAVNAFSIEGRCCKARHGVVRNAAAMAFKVTKGTSNETKVFEER